MPGKKNFWCTCAMLRSLSSSAILISIIVFWICPPILIQRYRERSRARFDLPMPVAPKSIKRRFCRSALRSWSTIVRGRRQSSKRPSILRCATPSVIFRWHYGSTKTFLRNVHSSNSKIRAKSLSSIIISNIDFSPLKNYHRHLMSQNLLSHYFTNKQLLIHGSLAKIQ